MVQTVLWLDHSFSPRVHQTVSTLLTNHKRQNVKTHVDVWCLVPVTVDCYGSSVKEKTLEKRLRRDKEYLLSMLASSMLFQSL